MSLVDPGVSRVRRATFTEHARRLQFSPLMASHLVADDDRMVALEEDHLVVSTAGMATLTIQGAQAR